MCRTRYSCIARQFERLGICNNNSFSFGSYSFNFEVANGMLVFTRKISMRSTVIPSDQYSEVRSFFQRLDAAEEAPVVLIRN